MNRVALAFGVLLVALAIVLGVLLARQSASLADANSKLTDAQSDIIKLSSTITEIQSHLSMAGVNTAVEPTVPDVVKKVAPAIVRIDATGPGFKSSGSGFIVDPRGYVVTNQHVIDLTTSIVVTLNDSSQLNASVINSDSKRDVAVLRLAGNRSDFPAVALGNTAGISVGEDVIAAGFPLGSTLPGPATFHRGIVSAFRTLNGLNYVQTDVQINLGNSGGALLDMSANVIGVTTAGIVPPSVDAEGIGLAIPVDDIKSIIQSSLGK